MKEDDQKVEKEELKKARDAQRLAAQAAKLNKTKATQTSKQIVTRDVKSCVKPRCPVLVAMKGLRKVCPILRF